MNSKGKTDKKYNRKRMKRKHNVLLNIKEERGITLIALVITIVVLLILAGVTISLTLGENGLLGRAQESKNEHEQGAKNDTEFMNNAYEYMNPYFNGSTGSEPTPPVTSNLTDEEKEVLTTVGIKELVPSEITNNNLKANNNIKGVITGEVPIPVGFSYKEGTKDTGVVVTDGESEFVWVPVENIEDMAILQAGSTENYQGVLYDFNGTTATKKSIETIGKTGGKYREPDVLKRSGNCDSKLENLETINEILDTSYETADQFQADLQKDFNKMVASVQKYKGFYIGRYEVSINFETGKIYSKVNILPTTCGESYGMWYVLYAYQKKMAETNSLTSVTSHMIWGCNYDAMLRWALEGEDSEKVTSVGNADHSLKAKYETGRQTVEGKLDRINNIYDLEGNAKEWTAETFDDYSDYRSIRGGYCDYFDGTRAEKTPAYRGIVVPTTRDDDTTSRIVLFVR